VLDAEGLGNRAQMVEAGVLQGAPGDQRLLLGVVRIEQLERLFEKLFDEAEFLSPHGLRAVSAFHREHPYELSIEGVSASIDYEPAESTTSMFGGNSNWRGPVWFPLNFLVVTALERYYRFFGDDLKIDYPTGSGVPHTLAEIAADLRHRLVSLFLRDANGRRPCFGGVDRLQREPAWRDNLLFNSTSTATTAPVRRLAQTGWTAVVADLIRGRPGNDVYTVGELWQVISAQTVGSTGATPDQED
jgi:hypothetical protein